MFHVLLVICILFNYAYVHESIYTEITCTEIQSLVDIGQMILMTKNMKIVPTEDGLTGEQKKITCVQKSIQFYF